MNTIINLLTAVRVSECKLRLLFDDATTQTIDFKPFLQGSRHPQIRAYLDDARFASFRIEYGELIWGDYALCFPIADLYANQIDKHHLLEAAA